MSVFLDLLIIVVAGVFLWLGFKKGFLKSLVDLIIMILSVIVPYLFATSLAEYYYRTFVYNELLKKINSILSQNGTLINSAKNILSLFDNIPNFFESKFSVHVPDLNSILKALNGYGDKSLAIESMLKPPIIEVLSVFMFVALAILTFILLKILFKLVLKLPRISVFGVIDSILGLCLGALKFVVFIFIFFTVLKTAMLLVPQKSTVQNINNAVENSKIFKSLYNINVDILNDYLKLLH